MESIYIYAFIECARFDRDIGKIKYTSSNTTLVQGQPMREIINAVWTTCIMLHVGK